MLGCPMLCGLCGYLVRVKRCACSSAGKLHQLTSRLPITNQPLSDFQKHRAGMRDHLAGYPNEMKPQRLHPRRPKTFRQSLALHDGDHVVTKTVEPPPRRVGIKPPAW